ncbi:MAG TPA: TonB-dependent receptor [Magnetospirillaceae bacterium]|jgi:outer membrane receptor protein involved in Fe transport
MGRYWGFLILAVFLTLGRGAAAGVPIKGTVHDALGRPISDAKVVLQTGDGKQVATTTSDKTGHFSFPDVGAGVYAVVGSKTDFEPATAIVSADATSPVPTELVLRTHTALDMAVTAKQLDEARNQLSPETGSNAYTVGSAAIEDMPQGSDTSFNHVLLQTPGAAQDSYGQIHLRGEHANLQYRINDILLPEGITGFGQVLDTRIAGSVEVLDGALPAQYGYRTSGVVDITTKSGAFTDGGVAEIYGGSRNTLQPSIEYGGSQGALNYFVSGSYLTDTLGVEAPTKDPQPIHDLTNQEKGFGYFSYLVNPFNRVSLVTGTSFGTFQVPNNPGQATAFPTPVGASVIPSSQLNENQMEVNHYATLAFQGTSEDGNLGYQVAPYIRYSTLHFTPDVIGDLEYNGIASNVQDNDVATGLQADGSYFLNNQHTLRAGFVLQNEHTAANNTSTVFPVVGGVTGDTPETITDNHAKTGSEYGVYVQDEWRLTHQLTMNYGARFDAVNAYINETQLSPRLGFVYNATETTTLHAGYARYFTPPPMELIASSTVSKFANTSANTFDTTVEDPVKSERSNDFDIGIEQDVTKEFKLGWDNYYKQVKNLLDEGQFGAALVYTPFNYAEGLIYGSEVTASYTSKQTTAYLNFAVSRAMGKDPDSQQATFSSDPTELAYAQTHWIHLDHDQLYTASGGVGYQVLPDLRVSADGILGSGLRDGFANTGSLPLYTQLDLGAVYHLAAFDAKGVDLRFSVINVFDEAYEIRDGTGIGVFAPQWGPRRGFYLGVSRKF